MSHVAGDMQTLSVYVSQATFWDYAAAEKIGMKLCWILNIIIM